MNALHPAFAHITQSFAQSAIDAHQVQIDAYIVLLKRHDWQFEYSSDHNDYKAGRAELAELRTAQKAIDPTFEVWNAHAPMRFRVVAK